MNKELQYLVYNTPEGSVSVSAIVNDETIWLTQKAMAELFGVEVPAISKHLANIYSEGELQPEATISKMEIVQAEGNRNVKRMVDFYNLDAIISVGYRVNSRKATLFRIWATKVLKEYMTKGFAMDDDRLKQGKTVFGKDYFRELLERVRSIRASERRIWLQITDIFAECSIDYDKDADITHEFYAMVQNKFHYAITGKTAAEIIDTSADKTKDHMGLTSWKNAPDGRILKSDVTVAKNYLDEKQIRQLERLVTGYFDYIEDLIERENTFTMEEFAASINEFLAFRKYDILKGNGSISKTQADEKAKAEYDEFNKTQKILSDFEKSLKAVSKEKRDE
jgi:virulence protein